MRTLERSKRNGSASAVGRWRTPAASVGTWQRGGWQRPASLWLTFHPSSHSAGEGALERQRPQENDGLDALATALAASRRTSGWRRSIPSPTRRRRCACFPRGAKTWWPSAPGRSRQPARASTRPRARRDSRNALGRPGCTHPARHTTAGLLLARPPPTSFGGPALRIRTLDRKLADLNERIESEE
jgi:hypothetical protein